MIMVVVAVESGDGRATDPSDFERIPRTEQGKSDRVGRDRTDVLQVRLNRSACPRYRPIQTPVDRKHLVTRFSCNSLARRLHVENRCFAHVSVDTFKQ
jgi:hypothetical protein